MIYSAITGYGSSHVIVAEMFSSCLHIHHVPSGQEIRNISGMELGLDGLEYVHAVHCDDKNVYLAVGTPLSTRSLKVYEVCPHFQILS